MTSETSNRKIYCADCDRFSRIGSWCWTGRVNTTAHARVCDEFLDRHRHLDELKAMRAEARAQARDESHAEARPG
jgi:hypothetical protein